MPASHTILVVASDQALRRSMRFALEAEGLRVITATRVGSEGDLDSLPTVSCVVLDDHALAASDGRRIQQLGLPIVFLSDGLRGPGLAAKHVLMKPLLGRELIDAVFDIVAPVQAT